jgi:outer membrane protein assembly factor BamB
MPARRRWRWRWQAMLRRFSYLGALAVAALAVVGVVQLARGAPGLALLGRFAAQCPVDPVRSAQAAPLDPTLGLASWTTFQGSAGHNLVLPGAVGQDPLSTSWTFRPGAEMTMAPSVVGGIAYLSSLNGCVYALDAASGQPLWAFHTDNEVMSEPLVVGGRVFVGTGNKVILQRGNAMVRGSGANTLYALSQSDGQLLWQHPTLGENMPTQLYADGRLYSATGGGEVYALQAATGQTVWQTRIGSVVSMSSMVAWGHTAIVGGANPYAFYGIDLATGRIAWTLPIHLAEGGVDDITPAVAHGVAFVQVPEGAYPNATVVEWAIDVQNGRNLWQTLLGTGSIAGPDNKEETGVATVVQGVVYVGSPALKGLWALSAHTGQPLWKAPTPLPAPIRAAPTVDGPYIFASGQGELYVIDRQTGALLRALHVGTPVPGTGTCTTPSPLVVGQTLYYAAGADNVLVAAPVADVLSGRLPAGAG